MKSCEVCQRARVAHAAAMPDTPLLPSDEELPTIEVPDGYLHKGHWIQNCRSAARNGGATIKVLPTIDELPTIKVPLVQLPKMSRTPWASFASPSPTTIPSSETPTSTVRASCTGPKNAEAKKMRIQSFALT